MKYRQLVVVLAIIQVCVPSSSIAGQMEDFRPAIRTILEAIKSRRYDYSSAGSAISLIDNNGIKHERLIDFKFKGPRLTRSDAHILADGEKGDFECIWTIHDKGSVVYNGASASIEGQPPSLFYRQIGYDFHPETFSYLLGRPLTRMLEGILNTASEIDLDLDDEGVFHISAKFPFKDPEESDLLKIALDSTKEYALTSWEYTKQNGIETVLHSHYESEWEKRENGWYIRKVSFQETVKTMLPLGESPKMTTTIYKADTTVTEFVDNPQIEDSEFTFEALDIPAGTMIYDNVLGIAYTYGSGAVGAGKLEGPLFEAEFFKTYNEKNKTEDINNIDQHVARTDQLESDERSIGSVPDLVSAKPIWRNILVAVVLLGPLIFVIFRRVQKQTRTRSDN